MNLQKMIFLTMCASIFLEMSSAVQQKDLAPVEIYIGTIKNETNKNITLWGETVFKMGHHLKTGDEFQEHRLIATNKMEGKIQTKVEEEIQIESSTHLLCTLKITIEVHKDNLFVYAELLAGVNKSLQEPGWPFARDAKVIHLKNLTEPLKFGIDLHLMPDIDDSTITLKKL